MKIQFELPVIAITPSDDVAKPHRGILEPLALKIEDADLGEYVHGLGSYEVYVRGESIWVHAEISGDPQEVVARFDGQMSDGWGEWFEQYTFRGLYISLWAPDWRKTHPFITPHDEK